MSNFIFSINVTVPIFLIILLGYILRKMNFLTDEFARVANKYVFSIALPAMLFLDVSKTNVESDMNPKFFWFCLIVTIAMFVAVFAGTRIFIKDKSIVGAFAQASARGSAAVLGVAFVENICGEPGMTPLMIVAAVPFFNILSVIILVCSACDEKKDYSKIKNSIINIGKNPIILSILAGVIVSLIGIKLNVIFERSVKYLSNTATPIALLAIGAGFDKNEAIKKIKPAVVASLIKLLILPAVFLPIAAMMKFSPSEMVAILIMLASPTTVSCYIMAKNMNNDGNLTSNVIVITTLMSSITLTMWIFILRSFGLI